MLNQSNKDQNKECIDVCNSLLRGELSAVETYTQAIEKLKGQSEVEVLQRIRAEHVDAVEDLRKNVADMGGSPENESGLWGSFAQLVQGGAGMLGTDTTIQALEQGEKIGKNDYEDALKNDDVMIECKNLIKSKLLPRQKSHLSSLNSIN